MNNVIPIEQSPLDALHAHYENCVRRFLKTVVVFDDKAYEERSCAKVAALSAPPSIDAAFSESFPDTFNHPAVEVQMSSDHLHELDGPGLMRCFGEKGIACSVIQPLGQWEEKRVIDDIVLMAKGADVLILDWTLKEGSPDLTCNAIQRIFEDDDNSGERLRLVVIYTAQSAPTVAAKLERSIAELERLADSPITFQRKHAVVVIFNKPGGFNVGVTTEELPSEIMKAHAKLTGGLLPSAALNAIAAIRENTHHLLGQFSTSLDGAYIAHRCLIPHPEDAETYFIDLFADALHSIVMHESTRDSISVEKCESWVRAPRQDVSPLDPSKLDAIIKALSQPSTDKAKYFRDWLPSTNLAISEDLKNRIDIWLADEVRSCSDLVSIIGLEAKVNEEFLEALVGKQQVPDTEASDLLIARLYPEGQSRKALDAMTTLSDFSRTPSDRSAATSLPRLHLGTVLAREEGGQYEFLLCVQPHCDSVRLGAKTLFPFLRLKQNEDVYDLCLPWKGSHLRVTLEKLPRNLEMISFLPANKKNRRFVEARLESEQTVFKYEIVENGQAQIKTLIWVGELRMGKAQRLSSQLAARLHTLGVDEFEYSRLRGR